MSTQPFNAAEHQASTLYLPAGSWLTVLDCLCEHFRAISREQWLDRIARGRVLDADGAPISAQLRYKEGLRIHYFREVPNETPIPVAIDLDTCSRACSRSAWAISWPITAARGS